MTEALKTLTKNKQLLKQIIANLDYNQENESMKRTALRVSAFLNKYKKKTEVEIENFKREWLTTFTENGAWNLIVKRDIDFHSLCEHHMLPFYGVCDIVYLPNSNTKKIIGLSKLTRIVNFFSRQLHIQENLTREIAEFIEDYLDADAVWVIMKANHMCEQIRGVENKSETITSVILGDFKTEKVLKREAQFLLES